MSTASGFLARGFSLGVSLLTIRIVFGELGKEAYGIWAVITTAVVWSTLFDFGVLNGLVNAIAEAFGKQDEDASIGLTSTAFYALALLALFLVLLSLLTVPYVPWDVLLSSGSLVPRNELQWAVLAALGPFIAGIPLGVVRQVYAGYQRAYVSNVFTGLGAVLSLAAVLAAAAYRPTLAWLVLASAIGPPVAGLLNLLYMRVIDMPWLTLRLRRVSRDSMRRLLRSSVPLFLLQSAALLVNYSQPIVLAHLVSYALVAEYSLLFRLYVMVGTVVVLATSSFFPAFREAFERGERGWVRENFLRMLMLRLLIACGLAVSMIVGGNDILAVWLGRDVASFPTEVWLAFAAILVFSSWGTAFADLLTIMDRLWLQVAFALLNGVLTVVLTVVLAPRLGVLGAMLAFGFTAITVWSWVGPVLSRSILARGPR